MMLDQKSGERQKNPSLDSHTTQVGYAATLFGNTLLYLLTFSGRSYSRKLSGMKSQPKASTTKTSGGNSQGEKLNLSFLIIVLTRQGWIPWHGKPRASDDIRLEEDKKEGLAIWSLTLPLSGLTRLCKILACWTQSYQLGIVWETTHACLAN